jgi:putative ABC transport system ATP-binding protein
LTKTYGAGPAQIRALRGVDLDVRPGEMLMVVGPSGCGKTTLLSILSGILDPDEGECIVLGHDVRHMGERERVRFRGRSIGFVFQLFNLLPALTAEENVAVPLLLARWPRKEAVAKAARLLDSMDLGERRSALPWELSGGQQQRVAIARSLVHDPELIVCDEPTSNLDHKAGHEAMAILRGLARRRDRSVIVVTHDARILDLADRVARMEDGRILDAGAENGRDLPP